MPQIINSNIASLTAQRHLNSSQSANSTALERLSSGLRINSAKDDAAGLAISTKFESQIKGLNVAIRNAGDGVSLTQTAEGALGSMTENLQRMRELAVQSSNSTNSDSDRVALQAEVSQLMLEVERTAQETNFNGRNLLDGSFNGTFQIGSNAGNTVDIAISELTTDRLGSSSQSGVSAIGTDFAIANGDLTINGVAVTASSSADDTSSFENASTSGIAKAAAVNRVSDESGVTAVANSNISTGSEMTGVAGGVGTFLLNGVSLDMTTSADTAATRASITQTINDVSTQTGVTALDTGSDADGIQLTAADGRNITLSAATGSLTGNTTQANFSSSTGLMGGLTQVGTTTTFSNTVETGFTLIAAGDTKEIVVGGGNGTGLGDITNSGLVAGTYEKGVASIVTANESELASGTSMDLDGTLIGLAGIANAAQFTTAHAWSVAQGGVSFSGLEAIGSDMAALANNINTGSIAAGTSVSAWEDINFTLDLTLVADDDTLLFTGVAAGAAIALEAVDTNATIVEKINGNAQTAANGLVYNATLTDAGLINMHVKNYSGVEFSLTTAGATFNSIPLDGANNAAFVVAAGTLTAMSGDLHYESTDGTDATIDIVDTGAGNDLVAAGTSASSSGGTVNGLDAGDLVINGTAIGAAIPSNDVASSTTTSDGFTIISSSKSRSAIAVAAAINLASDATGVTASADPTIVNGGDGSNADVTKYAVNDTAQLYINGVDLGTLTLQDDGSGVVSEDDARLNAMDMINAASGQTGVTAVDNGASLTLTAADGRNVSIAIDNQTTGSVTGLVAAPDADSATKTSSMGAIFGLDGAVSGIGEQRFAAYSTPATLTGLAAGQTAEAMVYETTYGSIKLDSASSITVSSGSNGSDEVEALGMTIGSYGNGTDGTFLKDVDISTFQGAQDALTALDNALDTISAQRSELGAMQNRFESTSSNLQITSENLSAANSRIRDADFATETAELSRTQVLQQAGISILAQANQRPQQVLSLLG